MKPTALQRTVAAIGVVLVALILSVAYHRWQETPIAHVNVHDDFEEPRLSRLWSADRFEPGAVTMQSEVTRAGRGAARIVVRSRDKFEAGVEGDKDSERAELLEATRLVSREEATYEYSFSDFIPADFPIVPVRLVIAQWKQYCNGHTPCSNDSPVVALRYVGGVLFVTRQEGRRQVKLYETRDELRGKWTDFRFRIRFTPRPDGFVQAWMNGGQIVDYRGATAYPENASTGYASPSYFYFKMGLYRDVMETPMTIYIDEYRKRQL